MQKRKKMLAALGIVSCLSLGGVMMTQAAGYVQGNIPGFKGMSCTGSLGYTSKTLTAATSCNKTPGGYETKLTGRLKMKDTLLPSQTRSGGKKATISDTRATGYYSARGTHSVYYRNKTWRDNTSI